MSSVDGAVLTVLASDDAASASNPLGALVSEAERQLTICNACRYCEGLCAVFPALERRIDFTQGDVSQIANLCHDCRACYDACMYSSPHEFQLDLPQALSSVRLADYSRYVWPTRPPRLLTGWTGLVLTSTVSAVVVFLIALAHAGWSGLARSTGGSAASPYKLIPYGILVGLMFAALLFAVGVMIDAGRRYWKETGTTEVASTDGDLKGRALRRSGWQSLTLRYLRGGGQECYYPDDEVPSPRRRQLHMLMVSGFGLCLLSTIAAAVEQDIIGTDPPYPWLSVPVLSGVLGGVALFVGCAGLLALKAKSSPTTSVAAMNIKDYGLLVALMLLAASGMAVLLTRETPAYGIVLLVHLAALVEAFALWPYSKLVHMVFRFLALVRDNEERMAEELAVH